MQVETRQVKAGAFDIPLIRRDLNGTATDENASGYTGFAKYKFSHSARFLRLSMDGLSG